MSNHYSNFPPSEVIAAIENGTTETTRRAEIYESDGETPWPPRDSATDTARMIDGSVSLDYSRNERRTFDLELKNTDGLLRPNSRGGFWYDKVIKLFRGVRYPSDPQPPRVVIIEAKTDVKAYEMAGILKNLGYTRVDVLRNASVYSEIANYDLIVSYMEDLKTTKSALILRAYAAGKKIITVGANSSGVEIPLISAGIPVTDETYRIEDPGYDTAVSGGWGAETFGTATAYRPTAVRTASTVVAIRGSGFTYPMAIIENNAITGGRWFHYQPFSFGTQGKALLGRALTWLRNYQVENEWETQLGEFVIDKIDDQNFPNTVKCAGRDYTKRCLTSKLEKSMSFRAGTPIVTAIRALAVSSGIKKFRLPVINRTLATSLELERGTERWEVMKNLANSREYDIFFDNQGYLTMREMQDPTYSPIAMYFSTGQQGNMMSYQRSLNDSRLYNHIIITGENESQDGAVIALPYFGEAVNTNSASPTNVDRIGRRTFFYTSSFFTSDEQCQSLAQKWLKLRALESYELSFESLCFPWADVGFIAEVLEPNRIATDPTRFLLDSITIPMSLSPMSATGKRVTLVEGTSSEVLSDAV